MVPPKFSLAVTNQVADKSLPLDSWIIPRWAKVRFPIRTQSSSRHGTCWWLLDGIVHAIFMVFHTPKPFSKVRALLTLGNASKQEPKQVEWNDESRQNDGTQNACFHGRYDLVYDKHFILCNTYSTTTRWVHLQQILAWQNLPQICPLTQRALLSRRASSSNRP